VAPPASVQVFGRKDSRATQAALRFFRERRIQVSMVDIASRAPAPTELRRFAQRLGPRALMDIESKAYRDQGLGYLSMGDDEVLERLLADPRLLRLPLVRAGDRFTAGPEEAVWRSWLQA
jgi:arsenate reductase-like glutaredoxin family protein